MRFFTMSTVWLSLLSSAAWAYQDGPSPDELMYRIQQLEAETAAMRAELQFSANMLSRRTASSRFLSPRTLRQTTRRR